MATRISTIVFLVLGFLTTSWAQLRPPNDAGVAMGEWHTIARDVDAEKKFWISLGGKPIRIDGIDVVKFPGTLVFISKGQPSGGSEGTVIDHVGLHSPNGGALIAKLKSAGVRMGANAGVHRVVSWGYIYSPDGLKIEILDSAVSTAAQGSPGLAPAAPLSGSIAADHIHFFYDAPVASLTTMQDWYCRTFGGAPFVDPVSATGASMLAGNIPGIELKFSKAPGKVVPTEGRVLDRIGFEVKDLQDLCETLRKSGVKFSEPYSKTRHRGYASAEFTDPWGASIELTEGLRKY